MSALRLLAYSFNVNYLFNFSLYRKHKVNAEACLWTNIQRLLLFTKHLPADKPFYG